jgi:hypothetical protein
MNGYFKRKDKYHGQIRYKKESYLLGIFDNEIDAIRAYKMAKAVIRAGLDVEKNLSELSTNKNKKYCFYDKSKERFIVNIRIGSFKTENEANEAAINAIEKLKN